MAALLVEVIVPTMDSAAQGQDPSSMIYRGRVAIPPPSGYNGTPYWDNGGFRKGAVMFNGRLYEGVLLRIDASQGSLLVRPSMDYVPIIPEGDQVSWLEIDGERYVNLVYQGIQDAEPGFYKVICDGTDAVLEKVTKKYLCRTGDNSRDIGYVDPDYDRNLVPFYQYRQKFYLLSPDGKLVRLSNKSSFVKMFPGEAASIRRHMRSAGLSGRKVEPAVYYKEAMALLSSPGVATLPGLVSNWHPVEGSGTDIRAPRVRTRIPSGMSAILPEGYFALEPDGEGHGPGTSMTVTFRNKIYEIGQGRNVKGTKARVRGVVMDGQFDEPLPGVVVADSLSGAYTVSDAAGAWELMLPLGSNVLDFQASGKEDIHLMVAVNGDGEVNLTMNVRTTELEAAIVSDESRMNHRTAQMGLERVSIKTIGKIPSAFGEGDVLKAVLTLPGVKTVGEASGGFNVRGGSSDQNLVLFNEGTIFNPSHLFGIFSSFNPDVVSDVMLYKSSIPSEYGGRISSVLKVDGKTGDPEKFGGSLGIGLLTSRFHVEGPVRKGKTTFLLGGRTTYSDWLLGLIPESSAYSNGSAWFADANLALSHELDSRNSIQLFGYYSQDKFSFNKDNIFHYSNMNAALRYNHLFLNGTKMTVSAGADHYGNALDDFTNASEAYKLKTFVDQAFVRAKFQKVLNPIHTVSYGLESTVFILRGGMLLPLGEESKVIPDNLGAETATEFSIYAMDACQLGDKLSVDLGVRLGAFAGITDPCLRVAPEMRISGKWSFSPTLSVKAGVNTMRQNIHLISNSASISPMDTWKLSDSRIRPTDGWQSACGVYWTVFSGKLDLSLESYYKRMSNYLDYRSGAVLSMNPNLADDLVPVQGKAYGVEFMAKKPTGRLTGWVSYSYSRTLLQDVSSSGISAINGGQWYNAPYDKPHDFKMVGNFAITKRYSFSANIDYSTGRPVTLPVGYYSYGGGNRLLYSQRGGYRLPDYFRLDLAINIDPGHYLKAFAHASFTIGCYNVTGRKNAYSVFYTTNGGTDISGHMVSVFAVPIPYINLNLLF